MHEQQTKYPPTSEQETAREKFATGQSLAIEAGAGAGKTSTLTLLAQDAAEENRRGQYIALNKPIVTEAGAKMPSNVTCSTAHSLAWRNVIPGTRFQDRLKNSRRMKSLDLATRLGINEPIKITLQDGTFKSLARGYLAGLTMRAVTQFCQSADTEPGAEHVPYIDGIDLPPGARDNNRIVARALVPWMRKAWADITDEHGSLPFKHEHYLKMWHLKGPRINADFILFDEAQDANPVMLAIVKAQTHAQIVWVGDSQQQIYTFTGAVNALQQVGAEHEAYLTRSFRFGPEIADVANVVLRELNAPLQLTGTDSIPSRVGPVAQPKVTLSRTNASAVRGLLETLSEGQTAHLVGGGREVTDFAKAAQRLMDDGWTEHPELACFSSWGEVQEYVEQDEQGGDLRLLVDLIEEFGVARIVEALENMPSEDRADRVFSTAHKSKGREWDSVRLADDFPAEPKGEELRLLYVAVTRAKLALDTSGASRFFEAVEGEQDDDEPVELAEGETAAVTVTVDEDGAQAAATVEKVEPLKAAALAIADAVEAGLAALTEHEGAATAAPAEPEQGAYSLTEDLAGRPGTFVVFLNGAAETTVRDSREAMELASRIYGATGGRVTVMDDTTGELVVEYDR